MSKPEYSGPAKIDISAVESARAAALPIIDGKQVVGIARRHNLSEPGSARTWYKLEDGNELVRDDAGNPAEWPD